MARGLGAENAQGSKVLERHAVAFIKEKEELDRIKKAKSAQEEKVKDSQRKFVEAMKDEGVKSFRLDKLGGFRTQVEVYVNVTKDGKVELQAFVKKRKALKFLWTTTINGSKLKSWVKELMEQGKKLPPGIDPYQETQIRRYK